MNYLQNHNYSIAEELKIVKLLCQSADNALGINMEVNKIEETKQPQLEAEVKFNKTFCRTCIYYMGKICTAPKLQFKICRGCPRAQQYIKKNVIQNIFSKIKSLAIMMKSMGMGDGTGTGAGSGTGSGGAGSGGSGGAGGAGGGGGGGGGA